MNSKERQIIVMIGEPIRFHRKVEDIRKEHKGLACGGPEIGMDTQRKADCIEQGGLMVMYNAHDPDHYTENGSFTEMYQKMMLRHLVEETYTIRMEPYFLKDVKNIATFIIMCDHMPPALETFLHGKANKYINLGE